MKDTDIIIVAPESHDYPFFRKFLHDVKNNFNKIIYVFTKNCGFNYSSFIKDDLYFVDFINSDDQSGNWYNQAINDGLDISTGKKILFIEPDFKIDKTDLLNLNPNVDVISFYETGGFRIWPSFLIVKTELINKTNRNFSAGVFEKITKLNEQNFKIPMIKQKIVQNNVLVDAFGKFTSDLLEMTDDFIFLNEIGIDFYHYSGITHNFTLMRTKEYKSLHNPKEFLNYLNENLDVNVNKHPFYVEESFNFIEILRNNLLK